LPSAVQVQEIDVDAMMVSDDAEIIHEESADTEAFAFNDALKEIKAQLAIDFSDTKYKLGTDAFKVSRLLPSLEIYFQVLLMTLPTFSSGLHGLCGLHASIES
jgi:hypothetical protein